MDLQQVLDNLHNISGAQIWLLLAALVFVSCAVMMLMIFRQINQHQVNFRGDVQDHPSEAILIDTSKTTGRAKYALTAKPTMIGRIAANDVNRYDSVVIPDVTVGRRHAVIEYHDNAFWLQDQGSVNGSYVNGERVDGEKCLKNGDYLKIHKFTFQFIEKNAERSGNITDPAINGPLTTDGFDLSPNAVLAGHGDTMLDIPRYKIEKQVDHLRTQVLNKNEFERNISAPHKLKDVSDAVIRNTIREATVRLVLSPDDDKTERLYSDLLVSPPVDRPVFEHDNAQDKSSENKNWADLSMFPDLDEKVLEALEDFFNDTADDLRIPNKLELTNKGQKLAQMGHFSSLPPVSHSLNEKLQNDSEK